MLKKLLLLLLISPLFLSAQDISPSFFYGEWKGKDVNKLGALELNKNGNASFLINGDKFGGKSSNPNAPKVDLTYTINLESKPIEIDFTAVKLASGDTKKLLGIVKVIDKNTLKLALNFDDDRPVDFEDDDTVILVRE